jgi:2-iminoacetate synthase ThiH
LFWKFIGRNGILGKKVLVIDDDPERGCEVMAISDMVAEITLNNSQTSNLSQGGYVMYIALSSWINQTHG